MHRNKKHQRQPRTEHTKIFLVAFGLLVSFLWLLVAMTSNPVSQALGEALFGP